MKSILDRSFRYTPSFLTDVRKTFARLREEQRRTGLETVLLHKSNAAGLKSKQPRAGEPPLA